MYNTFCIEKQIYGWIMLTQAEQAVLIGKILEIFKANKLNLEEIAVLLGQIRSEFTDERLANVADQIAVLFLTEKLSIEDGARILMACSEMIN